MAESTVEFIHRLEGTLPLESIRADGIPLWPLLRHRFVWAHVSRSLRYGDAPGVVERFKPWGIAGANLRVPMDRRPCRQVVLTSSLNRRPLDGRMVDKQFEWLLRKGDPEETLVLEDTRGYVQSAFRREKGRESRRVPFERLHARALNPLGVRATLEGFEQLDELNREHGFSVDARQLAHAFARLKRCFDRLFEAWNPKVLWVSCYYGVVNQTAIYVAGKRGIPVVEVQHGTLSTGNACYFLGAEMGSDFFPDHLLVYGEAVKESFCDNRYFIPLDRIHVAGHPWIELIRSASEGVEKPDALRRFTQLVGVTLQANLEAPLLDWVEQAAARLPGTGFCILPRQPIEPRWKAPNMIVVPDWDFYRLIPHLDRHCTVYSTCAFEAPAFGVSNCLANVDGLSRRFLPDQLLEQEGCRVIESGEELLRSLKDPVPSRAEVRKVNRAFIAEGFEQRLERIGTEMGLFE